MNSRGLLPAMILVAFGLPIIPIHRAVEGYPMESLKTDEESAEAYDPSLQFDRLIENIDKIEDINAHRREEALENVQKMFGIRSQIENKSTRHKTPPQFMMELYKTIADPSGVTRGKNPYNAKIVRSFIEKDSWLSHLYLFNISGLEINESVLEAELHLYRKRTSLKVIHPAILSSPYYLIRVYQVLEGKSLNEPDLHRLLNVHYVGAHASGWQVFNVKQAVLAWVSGAPNLGLIVTASTLFDDEVTIEFSRRNEYHHSKQPILVLFDNDNSDGKSHEGDNFVSHYYTYDNDPDETDLENSKIVDDNENQETSENLAAPENLHRPKRHEESSIDEATISPLSRKRSRINEEKSYGTQLGNNLDTDKTEYLERHKRISRKHSFANEEDDRSVKASLRADEDGEGDFPVTLTNSLRPKREAIAIERAKSKMLASKNFAPERRTRGSQVLVSMDIYERAMLREQTKFRAPKSANVERAAKQRDKREKRSVKEAEIVEDVSKSHANTTGNTTECGRHELYVDFKEIGLSSSIIAPMGYSAYHCQGPCNSPLSQDQQPTNHATVQGIVHKMGLVNDVHMPCCVPTKLLSTSILFFDDNENVVLKVYEDMIADRCGCR